MGLFSRDKQKPIVFNDGVRVEPTLDEASEDMKATAIEYIVSLDKADKDRFLEGVELIWQGYNGSVDKVRTRHQKALHREARQAGIDDDSDLVDLLDDEPAKPPKLPSTEAK